ncbi:MAG: GNAT family N-acetyltransferase, partial [bacterium]|nr:GNAT family N-acetyltransferase [bacterium]
MKLIKAETTHVDELVRISKDAFDSDVTVGATKAGGPPNYDSKEWHLEMVKEQHLYTAIEDEKIVGGAIIFEEPNKREVTYIGRIFVDPACFRKGYGTQLMILLEKLNPKTRFVKLDTPIWNTRTNAFYKKLGYIEVNRD